MNLGFLKGLAQIFPSNIHASCNSVHEIEISKTLLIKLTILQTGQLAMLSISHNCQFHELGITHNLYFKQDLF